MGLCHATRSSAIYVASHRESSSSATSRIDPLSSHVLAPCNVLSIAHSPFLGPQLAALVLRSGDDVLLVQLTLLLKMRAYATLSLNRGATSEQLCAFARHISEHLQAEHLVRQVDALADCSAINAVVCDLPLQPERAPAGVSKLRTGGGDAEATMAELSRAVAAIRATAAEATAPVPLLFSVAETRLVFALTPLAHRLLQDLEVNTLHRLKSEIGTRICAQLLQDRLLREEQSQLKATAAAASSPRGSMSPSDAGRRVLRKATSAVGIGGGGSFTDVTKTSSSTIDHVCKMTGVQLPSSQTLMDCITNSTAKAVVGDDGHLRLRAPRSPSSSSGQHTPRASSSPRASNAGGVVGVRPPSLGTRLATDGLRELMISEVAATKQAMTSVGAMLGLSPMLPRLTPIEPSDLAVFKRFGKALKATYCDENLQFWEEAMLYKAIATSPFAPTEALVEYRALIVDVFVRADAACAINIESALCARIVKRLSSPPTAEDFDEALKVAEYLMKEPFGRFTENVSSMVLQAELAALQARCRELPLKQKVRTIGGIRASFFSAGALMQAMVKANLSETPMDAAATCQRLLKAKMLVKAPGKKGGGVSERSMRSVRENGSAKSSDSDFAASFLRNPKALVSFGKVALSNLAAVQEYTSPYLIAKVQDRRIIWGYPGAIVHLMSASP